MDETKDDNEQFEKELKRSKENLERKSKLYEEKLRNAYDSLLNKESDDEQDEGEDLIDFERKVINSSKESLQMFDNLKTKSNDDEMVEYIDSFGRTRKCKRKELNKIEKLNEQELLRRNLDRDLNKDDESFDESFNESNSRSSLYSELYSNFVRPETDSKQINEPPKDSHYQDVSKNERREHGTSYYQFSLDEERRKEQIQELNKLRDQTVVQRKKADELIEKRNAATKQRLLKLAKRKGILVENDEALSDDEINEKINLNQYIKSVPKDEDKKLDLIDYSIDLKDREIREWDPWDREKLMETPFFIVDTKGSNSSKDDKSNLGNEINSQDNNRNSESIPSDFNSSKNKKLKTEQSVEDKVDEFLKFTMNKI